RVGSALRRVRARVTGAQMFHYGWAGASQSLARKLAVSQQIFTEAGARLGQRAAARRDGGLEWTPLLRRFEGTPPRCAQGWIATRLGALLRRARADLVLVFKGTKLEPADVAELKERFGARWVNWFPDDPHELGVSLALGPAYDYLFTHDSSSLERHRRAGTRAAYLAFGCDPAYHRPLDGGARWRAPLVFVGSRDRARERVVQELAGLGLVAWGPGWPNGPAYGDDFVRVLSGATVGLNIHQHFGEGGDPARYGSGANMRVFELAAIGTPQLADARGDLVRPPAEPEGTQHVIPHGSDTRLILGQEIERDEALDAIPSCEAHPRAALAMLSRVDYAQLGPRQRQALEPPLLHGRDRDPVPV